MPIQVQSFGNELQGFVIHQHQEDRQCRDKVQSPLQQQIGSLRKAVFLRCSLLVCSLLLLISNISNSMAGDDFARFTKHTDEVRAVAVSRDGKFIATAGRDMKSYIISAKTFRMIKKYDSLGAKLTGVVWMKDKSLIYSSEFNKKMGSSIFIRKWDVKKPLILMKLTHFSTYKIRIAPDESKVAASKGNGRSAISLLPSQEGYQTGTVKDDPRSMGLAFSSDSRFMISPMKGAYTRWLYDNEGAKNFGTMRILSDSSINDLEYSPDDKMVAVGLFDGSTKCFHETKKDIMQIYILEGHSAKINRVVFSPNGKWLATASDDQSIRLWDITAFNPKNKPNKYKSVKIFKGHKDKVLDIAWLPDSKTIVSASADKTVKFWDITGKRRSSLVPRSSITITTFKDPVYRLPTECENKTQPKLTETKEAIKLVQEIFSEQYKKASSTTGKAKLAIALTKEISQDNITTAERYALLVEVARLTQESGQVKKAVQASNDIIEVFKIDALNSRVELINKLLKQRLNLKNRTELIKLILVFVTEAIDQEKIEQAESILRNAYQLSKKITSRELKAEVYKTLKNVRWLKSAWENYKTASKTLASNSNDSKANFEVGYYLCVVKKEWKKGLAYLSKGSNEKLSKLASSDLANPIDAATQEKIGQQWQALAKSSSDYEKKIYLKRAIHWYRLVKQNLSGLKQKRIEKIILQLERKIKE